MLREVTRLTKGDFSKFDKVYVVERLLLIPNRNLSKKEQIGEFKSRDEALKYLDELDSKLCNSEAYYRIRTKLAG